jgi:thioredoxin 1
MQATSAQDFIKLRADSPLPIMVDFYADWCGPCQMLTPIIEELAGEFEGKVHVIKIDIDEAQEIAQEYAITSIPTILFIRQGEVVDKLAGFQSKDVLKEKLDAM